MHRTTTAILAAVIAAAGLTACSSSDKDSSTESKKTPPPPAASQAPATAKPHKGLAEAEARAGIPPRPDAAHQAAYIRAMSTILPTGIRGKEDRAVSRGRDTCGTIHSFPKDHGKQVSLTRARFSGATQITKRQAEQILVAVQTHLCPKN
ncbi:hypothetical protein ACH4PU_14770 [Streptomyces sp. NPDC021100]|uniref:hypothetical protein n=1 Tax=Streptomyces sp. NPDC021100 TaxID=3365114 RepID=UPI0037A6E223